MKSALIARLKRLENASIPDRQAKFRYGWLMPLPADYTGERHVVVTNLEATKSANIEWCHFEERPGPASANPESDAFTVYLTPE